MPRLRHSSTLISSLQRRSIKPRRVVRRYTGTACAPSIIERTTPPRGVVKVDVSTSDASQGGCKAKPRVQPVSICNGGLCTSSVVQEPRYAQPVARFTRAGSAAADRELSSKLSSNDLLSTRTGVVLPGGAKGTRTPDPHTASVVRYQLRHSPRCAHRNYTTGGPASKSLVTAALRRPPARAGGAECAPAAGCCVFPVPAASPARPPPG